MSTPDRISLTEIIIAVVLLIFVTIGIAIGVIVFLRESTQTEIVISDAASKHQDYVEVYVKLLTIDAVKGDATARVEMIPHGNILDEDGMLAQNVKLYVPSANGKTEIDFSKGKMLAPVEIVLSLYGGDSANYPFDYHQTSFYLYMEKVPADMKAAPKSTATEEPETTKPETIAEPESLEIPLDVSFFGSIPGFSITAVKAKESDEMLPIADVSITRSATVVAWSFFIGFMMWGLTIATLMLVLGLVVRKRKIEIAMFSFMAALLFAFYTVRQSQPNIPPIGVFSDFLFFFWAETVVALCLIVSVLTWVFRTTKT